MSSGIEELSGGRRPTGMFAAGFSQHIRLARLVFIFGLVLAISGHPARAQETNAYPIAPTKLDALATNVDTVLIKASTDVGTVAAESATLGVKCLQITDASSGRREEGIAIEFISGSGFRVARFVDYDELTSLLAAFEYINKVDWSVTTLNSFDAGFTTRSGFRLAAFSSKRSGFIEFSVRLVGLPPVLYSRSQMAQLGSVIEQAKTKLDSIRGK